MQLDCLSVYSSSWMFFVTRVLDTSTRSPFSKKGVSSKSSSKRGKSQSRLTSAVKHGWLIVNRTSADVSTVTLWLYHGTQPPQGDMAVFVQTVGWAHTEKRNSEWEKWPIAFCLKMIVWRRAATKWQLTGLQQLGQSRRFGFRVRGEAL